MKVIKVILGNENCKDVILSEEMVLTIPAKENQKQVFKILKENKRSRGGNIIYREWTLLDYEEHIKLIEHKGLFYLENKEAHKRLPISKCEFNLIKNNNKTSFKRREYVRVIIMDGIRFDLFFSVKNHKLYLELVTDSDSKHNAYIQMYRFIKNNQLVQTDLVVD